MNTETIEGVTINIVYWDTHHQQLSDIRKQVFIDEQHVSPDEEWDTLDDKPDTVHLLALSHSRPVGCARITRENTSTLKIGRLAVLTSNRGQGIGKKLLRKVLESALSSQPASIYIHAQTNVKSFYENFGFEAEGKLFDEAGIPHQRMVFSSKRAKAITAVYQQRILRHQNAQDFIQHICQAIAISQRQIRISSEHLREDIFSNARLVQEISDFARSDSKALINILVHTHEHLHKRSLPLVALAKRLPSKISIHILNSDYDETVDSFVVGDDRYLTYFNDESALSGFTAYSAAAESRTFIESFTHLWNHQAKADKNLAQLYL